MKRFFVWIRKRILPLAGVALVLLLFACSGDDDGSGAIDCAQEAALVGISDDSDQGGMTVQFEIQYTGDLPVRTVTWDFGDGTKDSGASVSHLYINSGTYLVTALVELGPEDSSCIVEPTTSVTIQ
jgi:hypothetical protein